MTVIGGWMDVGFRICGRCLCMEWSSVYYEVMRVKKAVWTLDI